jgi:hypothetical protein
VYEGWRPELVEASMMCYVEPLGKSSGSHSATWAPSRATVKCADGLDLGKQPVGLLDKNQPVKADVMMTTERVGRQP